MPGSSRVVRGAVLSQAGVDYVQAAQARGESAISVVIREILPNIIGPITVDFSLRITWGIIALSTLSFLGLGVQPPQPDWGLMIQEGRTSLQQAPLVAIVPAIGIACLSVGFNLAADAIIRHFDRRQVRGSALMMHGFASPATSTQQHPGRLESQRSSSVRYPGQPEGLFTVWNVSFTLEPGTILGLAGESGCGKSTTAKAAIGFKQGQEEISGASSLGDADLLTLRDPDLRPSLGQSGFLCLAKRIARAQSRP